jgi:cobalamin biosynthesis protein CobT
MALVKKILADAEEPKGDDPWVDLPGGGGGDEESPTEPPPFGPKDPCEEGEEGEDGATGKGKTKAKTGEEEGDEDGGGGSEPGEDEGDEGSESGEDSGRNKNGGKGEEGEEPTDDQPEEASEDGEGDQGRRKNSEGGGVGKYNSIDDRHDADFGVIDFDNPEELTKILKKAGAEMKDESLKIIKVQATTLRRADAEDNRHRMAEKRRARIEWRNRTRRK